jgi:hypothetical protein
MNTDEKQIPSAYLCQSVTDLSSSFQRIPVAALRRPGSAELDLQMANSFSSLNVIWARWGGLGFVIILRRSQSAATEER